MAVVKIEIDLATTKVFIQAHRDHLVKSHHHDRFHVREVTIIIMSEKSLYFQTRRFVNYFHMVEFEPLVIHEKPFKTGYLVRTL